MRSAQPNCWPLSSASATAAKMSFVWRNGRSAHFGGVAGLAQANMDELQGIHGIGEAKATEIKAALELGKRLLVASPQERLQVRSPADVANLLVLEMGLLRSEGGLRSVLLDTGRE